MIDLSPLLAIVLQAAEIIATAAVPVVATYIVKRLHLANEAAVRDVLQLAASNGAKYAENEVASLQASGKLVVDPKNQVLALAAQYVVAHAPDAVAALKADAPAITRLVQAKLTPVLSVVPLVVPPAITSGTPK